MTDKILLAYTSFSQPIAQAGALRYCWSHNNNCAILPGPKEHNCINSEETFVVLHHIHQTTLYFKGVSGNMRIANTTGTLHAAIGS